MNMSKEEFILEYKGYAKIWADYYSHLFESWNIEFEDLYQVGCLRLAEVYDKYEAGKSSPSTYAFLSVKFAIISYIKKIVV